ncbi:MULTISPECIES: TrbC/VirB2 family protein [Plesiomonas]|uniref:TrbC/VirB2 family protein n=1 Tax=Plesiomonas TaxID=702 RepID=UPI0012629D07|nr:MULTISPECIES: TrbC/VirB2 family protein [Plesiomonas]KAB7692129.1 type IV secretion protein A [Plesiomonas shigelloides]MCE5165585.1 TrbC/VirB2 family protein [Plesiomonas sp. PI-19]
MIDIENNKTSPLSSFVMALCMTFAFLLFCSPEFAYAGGLDKVNNFMENIADILRGASVISVTVAVMISGYKLLFTQATIMEVGKILIAGLLIGGAAEIARYIVG